jgi:TPP-dependent pyruvate/acetoin dehydrogenase alpha subunit
MALAEKFKQSGAVVVAFLGDGTLGEGALYEALNLASLWMAPILYVLEDNEIAQTTPRHLAVAGDIADRFSAFGIPVSELDTSDVLEILPEARRVLGEARSQNAPRALILHTCRFGPHSKGDDTRDPQQVAHLRQARDPLVIHGARLAPEFRAAIEAQAAGELQAAFEAALADPYPVMGRAMLQSTSQ